MTTNFIDAPCLRVQSWRVQTRGRAEHYATAISNPTRFAGHVASREAVELLQVQGSVPTTTWAFTPVSFARLVGGFFPPRNLSRVAIGIRVRRASGMTALIDGEGMAQGVSKLNRPCLIGRASSSDCQSAGSNTGRRNKSSVGSGNHCARVFKLRSDRPTCCTPSKLLLENDSRGGLCSLPPSMLSTNH